MERFESSVKHVSAPIEKVHSFLSDFTNFLPLIPNDKITDWTCDSTTCRFVIKGIGEAGLRILEAIPLDKIRYVSNGKVPFNFYLNVHQSVIDGENSTLQLKVEADLNPMMKILASPHLEKFVDVLADAFAKYKY